VVHALGGRGGRPPARVPGPAQNLRTSPSWKRRSFLDQAESKYTGRAPGVAGECAEHFLLVHGGGVQGRLLLPRRELQVSSQGIAPPSRRKSRCLLNTGSPMQQSRLSVR